MKTHIAILFAALVVCGCDQGTQNSEHFGFAEMDWFHGATNGTMFIRTDAGLAQTNVTTLTYATEIAGQYGWEFVQKYDDGTHEIFYMKRRALGNETNNYLSLLSDLPPNLLSGVPSN